MPDTASIVVSLTDPATSQMIFLAIGAIILGIILLIKGGNWAVDGAVYTARKFGISPLVVGFTIVAFGTSLPELLVSVNANLKESAGIAIGNVLGSNIANILLVIGTTACLTTIPATSPGLRRDLFMMVFASIWMTAVMLMGDLSRVSGILMLSTLILYVVAKYIKTRQENNGEDTLKNTLGTYNDNSAEYNTENLAFRNMSTALLFLLIGFACIALGAEYLVRGAIIIAEIMHVPETLIGLTIIAFGTSLPELSTCIIAAYKKHADIVLGNIIGSNVFNILMIIGITSAIKPIRDSDITHQVIEFDIWVMLGVGMGFAAIIALFKKIPRPFGYTFVSLYLAYILGLYYLYM